LSPGLAAGRLEARFGDENVSAQSTKDRLREARRRIASVEKWQLDYLFDLGFQGWVVHMGVIALTSFFLAYSFDYAPWVLFWGAGMAVLSASLAALCRVYVSRQPVPLPSALKAGWAHSALTALVGLFWGGGAFGAAQGSFQVLLIYTLALGGTALGAVSSQHAMLRSCFISLWTSIPLLAGAHFMHANFPPSAVNASLIMLYALILTILSVRMNDFLLSNVELTRRLDRQLVEMTEITRELDLARRDAEEANLSKSRFLAQASHDLRQPIHAISLFTACLRDAGLGAEEQQMVDNIDRSLHSVSGLFRSLLDIAALDVGKVEAKLVPVAIGEILEDVVRQNAQLAGHAGIRLTRVPCDLWVSADPALLATMVQNIVSNAIKYAPGSKVLIGCRRRGGRLSVEICDQGPGIPQADVAKIFDEFYRVDEPAQRAQEGLGLGLSIVRRLAALQGLEVKVRSVRGQGTRVMIDGLALAGARGAGPRQGPALPAHPLRGLHILLIDDDESVLAATAMLLAKWGCVVSEASRLPEEKTGCDLIVTDFDLGGGYTAAQCLKDIRALEGADIPAVIITGHGEEEVRKQLGDDAVPVLAKPVRPAQLRSTITAQKLMMKAGRAAAQ
jgi:signal transduction histidine kinase